MSTHPPDAHQAEDSGRRRVGLVIPIAASAVFISLFVVAWNAIETSTARVNATTSTNSVFSAATIDLVQPDSAVQLLFDADGLYPGAVTTGCVEIEYRGSIPASVRLHGNRLGGTGLEDFVTLRILELETTTCPIDGAASLIVYEGLLGDLWRTRGSYATGVVLDSDMRSGDRFALHAIAEVVDDNAAQGLTTDFAITVEARP
ncbi:MAG: hypothetical protein ACR2P0_16370 [Acidimicrobiales bacterium]